MLTPYTIPILLFPIVVKTRVFLPVADCPQNISESIVDKLEQSYFATGYM